MRKKRKARSKLYFRLMVASYIAAFAFMVTAAATEEAGKGPSNYLMISFLVSLLAMVAFWVAMLKSKGY